MRDPPVGRSQSSCALAGVIERYGGMDNAIYSPESSRFYLEDPDLLRLALGALNVYAAQQFAGRHGLPLDEVPAGDAHAREFALLAPARRLEEVLLGLRQDRVVFGPVDCPDREALEVCEALGVPA